MVLIVGAGIAGLIAARRLRDAGLPVQVVDKGRGPGGRMATRRFSDARFDHGAQFLTARSKWFQDEVQRWVTAGVAREWFTEGGHPRYVGTDGMNGIAKFLAAGLDVETSWEAVEASPGWRLESKAGQTRLGQALIVTAPMPQALALLGDPIANRDGLAAVRYERCWALMARTQGAQVPLAGGIKLEGNVAWIADNAGRGTSAVQALTIHSSPAYAAANWDADPEAVARDLWQGARAETGGEMTAWQVHRWRYALTANPIEETCWTDPGLRLALAGDSFGAARVEGAAVSGWEAAGRVLDWF
jgi:predicted NAD/FAD-dependent oxidoreductase